MATYGLNRTLHHTFFLKLSLISTLIISTESNELPKLLIKSANMNEYYLVTNDIVIDYIFNIGTQFNFVSVYSY